MMIINNSGVTAVEVETATAADIQSKPIKWLWEPYLPIGTASVIFGEGGEGKSFASLAIAAAISTGTPLPGMSEPFPASDVIISNAENPWDMIIRPRLDILGADCTKIHKIVERDKPLTFIDERIEAAIIKHNAKLFIGDPIQSHLPSATSMGRAESVRPILTHLERVAERTGCCILLIGHVTKGRGKAQHRGLGSIDIINAVPSVMFLGRADGYDHDVRIIAVGKANFSEFGASLMFKLNKADGFQWLGECDATPDDIMNFSASKAREDKSKIDKATDFLTDLLSDESIAATEALELADEAGISKRTLERARAALEVQARRVDGHWVWSLQTAEGVS